MIGSLPKAGGVPRVRAPIWSIVWFTIGFALIAVLYTGLVFDFWAYGFFLLLVGSSYVAVAGYAAGSLRPVRKPATTSTSARLNIAIGLLSLVGILAIFYDRTQIRGIDYIEMGAALARAQLNRVGERGGMISIFGNLFSVIIYFPLINMIFDWEKWGRDRYLVFAVVLVGLLGLTYVTAGRTVILISIALVAAAMLGRGVLGQPRLPSFLTPGRLAVGLFAIVVLFGFVFAMRATAFGAANSADYLARLCIHLAQPAVEIMSQCFTMPYVSGSERVDELVNYATGILLYAFHVAWVGEVVIVDNNPATTVTFTGIQDMFLSRFGYQISATDYDGYFIPAAAGLVYDFGYIAMILGFLLIGILIGVSQRSMQAGRLFFGRIAFCYFAGGLMLCVLISPTNLPFYLLSIIVIGLVAVLLKLHGATAQMFRRDVAGPLQTT